MATSARFCASCQRSPPDVSLKHCAKCSTTFYCSRECQKADWKSHKRSSGTSRPSSASTSTTDPGNSTSTGTSGGMRSPKALSQPIRQPFTRLDNSTYLHPPMPEQDVYTLLIDAYRLRVTDTLNFDGPAKLRDEIFGGLSGASQTPLAGFRRFLELAAARGSRSGNSNATILPPWWDESKQEACLSLAQGQGQQAGGNDTELCEWLNLSRRGKVDKAAVIERYGDPQFPMQLRMLAEAVYQRGVGGMAGTAMRKTMARMEQGGTGDMSASLFSITRPNV